jgi:hypothetical protein
MKKQNNNLILFALISIGVLIGVFLLFRSLSLKSDLSQKEVQVPATENGIQVEAPKEIINKQAGEVDQAAFEKNQQVSTDTSLETLESELNNTVILEEDFSDL